MKGKKMLICSECGKECQTHSEEIGIGGYEFWGCPGDDRRFGDFSDCCDSPVEEKDEEDYFWEQKYKAEAEEVTNALKNVGGEKL
jgi:hypothetical protein